MDIVGVVVLPVDILLSSSWWASPKRHSSRKITQGHGGPGDVELGDVERLEHKRLVLQDERVA